MPNKEEYNILIFNQYFGSQLSWMFAGIEATMTKKESFHTCALALSTYTEIMGGLVTGNLKESGESRKNYEAFLRYLGQKYVDLDNMIKTQYPDRLKNLYSAVRSKLVHEFLLRESHFLVSYENPHDDKIGIELITNKTKLNETIQINFLIPEYYRDFKKGIENYKKHLVNSNELFARFIHALAIRDFSSTEGNKKTQQPKT